LAPGEDIGDEIEDRFASAVKAAVDPSGAVSRAPEATAEPSRKGGHSRIRVWGIVLLAAAAVTTVAIVVASVFRPRDSRLARLTAEMVVERAADEAQNAVDDVKQAIWADGASSHPRVAAPTPELTAAAPSPSIVGGPEAMGRSEAPTAAIASSAAPTPSAAEERSGQAATAFGVPSPAASSAATLASNAEVQTAPASTPSAAGEPQRSVATPALRNSQALRQMRRPKVPSKQPSSALKTGHRVMADAVAAPSGLESSEPEPSTNAQKTPSRGASVNSPASGETEQQGPPGVPLPRSHASAVIGPPGHISIGDSGVTKKPVEARVPTGATPAREVATAEAVRPSTASPVRARSVVVASADHLVYWALEDSGAIFRSTDQKTWQKQDSGVRSDLLGGQAPSEAVCWVVGRKGTILLTTDGTRWRRIPSPTTADLIAVSAASAYVADIVAADGSRFNTFDGGSNWQRTK
jgi:hypothetical protein